MLRWRGCLSKVRINCPTPQREKEGIRLFLARILCVIIDEPLQRVEDVGVMEVLGECWGDRGTRGVLGW